MKYDLTQQWFETNETPLGQEFDFSARRKFNYLRHYLRIPISKFQYEIKSISPKSKSFRPYWAQELKRIFEGHWVEHEVDRLGVNESGELVPTGEKETIAKWLPPWTHFHVNHWEIERDGEPGLGGVQKIWTQPMLRDLEWIRGYVFAVCKGFSGFEGDEEYTCYEGLRDGLTSLTKVIRFLTDEQQKALQTPDGRWKKYKAPLAYLYEEKPRAMGRAMFMNAARNNGDIEARGSGKTYDAAGRTGWGWVTEGMTDFDAYNRLRKEGNDPTTQQMFLSWDVKDQRILLRGFFKALEDMPGGGVFDGYEQVKKSPLYKRWKGGILTDTGTIEQRFERKKTGNSSLRTQKREGGSRSQLHVRSCFGDATAGNGPRCSHIYIEEAAFVENLIALMGQLIATTSSNGRQFGVIWLSGTGGETKGIATAQTRMLMENPRDYNCLEFANVMENINQTICMFVPGHLMLNQFKDKIYGNTDFVGADKWVEDEYRRVELSKNPKALLDLKTRIPRTLNDALLSLTGTKFPTAALTDVLTHLQVFPDANNRARPGYMRPVPGNNQAAEFVHDTSRVPLEDYPIKYDVDMRGAWMILEEYHPMCTYVGGADPYNQDEVKSSESVGACYIIRAANAILALTDERFARDRIVGWYVGRPKSYNTYYEQVRLGCCYFNAMLLAENETTLLRDHFLRAESSHLMAPPPPLLRANIANAPVRAFGQSMPAPVKKDLISLANRWLIEIVGLQVNAEGELEGVDSHGRAVPLDEDGIDPERLLNLHFICDPGLLREMIAYTDDGNFDRVIAFILALAQLYQTRGNEQMSQAHSSVTAMLAVLATRQASSRRQGRRLLESMGEFVCM